MDLKRGSLLVFFMFSRRALLKVFEQLFHSSVNAGTRVPPVLLDGALDRVLGRAMRGLFASKATCGGFWPREIGVSHFYLAYFVYKVDPTSC